MYTLILSLLLVIVAGVSQAAAANLLRVLVREESGSKMSVAVTQPSTLQASGQASRRLDPGKWYTLPLTSAYRITPSNNGLVQVGSNLYPGEIELRAWNNKAIAVNVLSLEEYLRSVVPSEMPASWHMDALMAQAVAARSYAVNTQRQRKWGEAPY
ncbi:MAG: SpoIID/LytB domain-containing protein, partial [Pseudanabaena sp. LacPavin_0818_WC45_MAG_42_6]|nr:SpoIID/LytB domain-containing protein [Pseudanabaena sp. LacPavin_0818_WC45_MAG_42_6]